MTTRRKRPSRDLPPSDDPFAQALRAKPKVGRPPKPERRGRKPAPLPEPPSEHPDFVAEVVLQAKPPEQWHYLEAEREQRGS